MRIALGVEYDGTDFCGWQIQHRARTVQQCLEQALSKVAAHPIKAACAGRTDAGVHAVGQVVHFDTQSQRSMRSWTLGANVNLPRDVTILWARSVDESFHARYSARSRYYRYIILNRMVRPALDRHRVCWIHRPLDESRMHGAAQYLLGEHDFSAYRAVACQAKNPVRNVQWLRVSRHQDRVVIDVIANAFLHHMVRNIAGVLMTIGAGEKDPIWAREVLDARDRRLGGVTAPPHGLYLIEVDYPPQYRLPGSQHSHRFPPLSAAGLWS